MAELDRERMAQAKRHTLQDEEASTATWNRRLAILGRILSLAVEEWGTLNELPVRVKQWRVTEAQHRVRYLSKAEERQVLELIGRSHRTRAADVQDLVSFLVDTGFRLSEALRLKGADVDLENQMVTAWETKAGGHRTVPMTQRVVSIVERRLRGANDYVFEKIDKETVKRIWRDVRREMDLEDDSGFVVHALRHTCGTRLALAGKNARLIQLWLGHSSMKMTERYTNLRPDHLKSGLDGLE